MSFQPNRNGHTNPVRRLTAPQGELCDSLIPAQQEGSPEHPMCNQTSSSATQTRMVILTIRAASGTGTVAIADSTQIPRLTGGLD